MDIALKHSPFTQTTMKDQFPETAFGGVPVDAIDEFLSGTDYARVALTADYTVGASQKLALRSTPLYSAPLVLFYEVVSNSLTENKIAKAAQLGAKYAALVAAGFNYQGNNYQMDNDSIMLMSLVKQQIKDGIPGLGYWRSTANVNVPMTDTEIVAFIDSAYIYGANVKNIAWTKSNAIMAAVDQTALDAVNLNTGWPSN